MQKLTLARPWRKFVAGLLLTSVFAAGPALAAKKDDTVRFAYDQAPESVDPFFNNVRIGVIIGANVWDTLVVLDPKTNEYKGNLATSWKQIDDKTIEFDLRKGVKFHNGEEFDADSVVYTLNFVADPANKVTTQANVNWIDKATKIDKYKVRLTTKQVFPAALEYLATPVVIHPAKYYAEVGPKGMNAKPVGTGPYRVTNYVPGKSITLERNPDYFNGPKSAPKINKVEIRFIPDRQTQMAEMLSGGADLIMHVPEGPGGTGREGAASAGGQRRDDAHRVHADEHDGKLARAAAERSARSQGDHSCDRPRVDRQEYRRRGFARVAHAVFPVAVRLH